MFSLPSPIPSTDLFDVLPQSVYRHLPETRISLPIETIFQPEDKVPKKRIEETVSFETLLYRRFLHSQQPCPLCERPLSLFQLTAVAPCAHLLHVECLEETKRRGQSCPRCQEGETRDKGLFEQLIVFVCCLNRFK